MASVLTKLDSHQFFFCDIARINRFNREGYEIAIHFPNLHRGDSTEVFEPLDSIAEGEETDLQRLYCMMLGTFALVKDLETARLLKSIFPGQSVIIIDEDLCHLPTWIIERYAYQVCSLHAESQPGYCPTALVSAMREVYWSKKTTTEEPALLETLV